MSRDIKFRAWNSDKKIMCYKNEDDSASYWDGVISSEVNLVNSQLARNFTYDWMQYTGLKDKNGKEIYEGDIVLHNEDASSIVKAVVEWNINGNWSFRRVEVEHLFSNHFPSWESEVIGNICENPELLNAT